MLRRLELQIIAALFSRHTHNILPIIGYTALAYWLQSHHHRRFSAILACALVTSHEDTDLIDTRTPGGFFIAANNIIRDSTSARGHASVSKKRRSYIGAGLSRTSKKSRRRLYWRDTTRQARSPPATSRAVAASSPRLDVRYFAAPLFQHLRALALAHAAAGKAPATARQRAASRQPCRHRNAKSALYC